MSQRSEPRQAAPTDEEVAAIRRSLTVAQRSALFLVSAWGGVTVDGRPADGRRVGRSLDARTLVALAARGLVAGGPDRMLRVTDLGAAVKE